jgi:MerR family transcriptional regulator, light-induced transcriptional regulator
MVYIRNKKVKGIDYAYLVQSIWDHRKNMSRQQTIKYLGKASDVAIEDIPEQYRSESKILTFISAFSSNQEEKKMLISKIQEEIFSQLTDCNVNSLVSLFQKYSRLFGLVEFYDKLLKPVMYKIGDLWSQEKLDVATEHASTNTALSLIKIINEQIRARIAKGASQYKIVICTPEGELHGLACNIIESLLLSKGFKVYNISTSVPTGFILDYIHNLLPDIIFISITLAENIKPAERLIKQIRLKYNNKLPVIVGGSALDNTSRYEFSSMDALVMKNASFEDIMKLVNASIKISRR